MSTSLIYFSEKIDNNYKNITQDKYIELLEETSLLGKGPQDTPIIRKHFFLSKTSINTHLIHNV